MRGRVRQVFKLAALVLPAAGLICLVLALVWITVPTDIHDGFEASALGRYWSARRFMPGAVVPERQWVRSGRQALGITVHSGDRFEGASDDGAATERAEIMEPWWLWSRSGPAYVYSFSILLPVDFPATSERVVIAQWKQLCLALRCRPDNPLLAIRYVGGGIEITRHDEAGKHVLYRDADDVRGRWIDFRFRIRFDARNGIIDALVDGQEVVHYAGPTLYAPAQDYPNPAFVYFKAGIYRDARHEPPWTLYFDEYRKERD